jgi:signal peptidase I
MCAQGVLSLVTAFMAWCVGQTQTPFALVYGDSMEPALHSGQTVRLNHALPQTIPRGSIVLVTQFPMPPLIKRVVGLPGETVGFHLGEVFINGKMLLEAYLPECQTTFSWNYNELTVGDDGYVVLGDNRLTSEDSRSYGIIHRNEIVATIDAPPAAAQLLDTPRYRIAKASKRASLDK